MRVVSLREPPVHPPVTDSLADAIRTAEQAQLAERPRGDLWRPALELDGDSGVVTTGTISGDGHPDWVTIFAHWGLDPEHWSIVEPLKVNAWEANAGRDADGTQQTVILRQYKANVRRRVGPSGVDVSADIADILTRPPVRAVPVEPSATVFAAAFSDPQLGKGLEGNGTAETVDRWLGALADVVELAEQAADSGVTSCAIVLPGDTIEGCSGFYPAQVSTVDLTLREQTNAARRLIVRTVCDLAAVFPHVTVLAAAGNHGENRQGGQAYTRPSDNHDLAVVDQARDVVSALPGFEHVEFVVPSGDRGWVVHDFGGLRVGVHHGNVGKGTTPAARVRDWWRGQSHGASEIGTADVLFTGHWHHLFIDQSYGKTIVGCPSMDNGSLWWASLTGQVSPPGVLTCALSPSVEGFVSRVDIAGR